VELYQRRGDKYRWRELELREIPDARRVRDLIADAQATR
jgi:hypothetical protein